MAAYAKYLPAIPSPLGEDQSRARPCETGNSEITEEMREIAARCRRVHKAKTDRFYAKYPWLRELSSQTIQVERIRRVWCDREADFYWETLRDTVMGEQHRSLNKHFLGPLPASTRRLPGYRRRVKKPMDFRKMTRRWDRGEYKDGGGLSIWTDFEVMVSNAQHVFPGDHAIHVAAASLREIYKEACRDQQRKADWMMEALRGDPHEEECDSDDELVAGVRELDVGDLS
jgi:hypothetical protein